MPEEKYIWTIGHSTHTFDKLVQMLNSFGIEQLVDVRRFPGSRRYPYFSKESLECELPGNGIAYIHIEALGGRRKAVKDSVNTAWKNESFRGYADYMETPEFEKTIRQLEQLAEQKRTVYMCSEAVWWSCHRSLISDYLKMNGWRVWHILAAGKEQEHPYSSPAKVVDGKLSYRANELF